ncbi:hypothetical protein H2509_20590 [Stappia sp. F7233]|uniref:Tip attachment protein J HDII-ins2 domain-containing protein n=2 Tax=Stappia albiluteola TaxID=2758565 RepID=A0A839AKE5_9HYPH|nr:host specificity factor TipJ family phage tail protein [Stappia albiluteola]MBA5779536.1 hypothetical protein [Stappia albiluteola]
MAISNVSGAGHLTGLAAPAAPCTPIPVSHVFGMTIADAVAHIPGGLVFYVEVDGVPVLRAGWNRILAPRENLTVIILPAGGSVKDVLGIVALIVLTAFAPYAGGLIATALGASATGLVAGIAGSVILAGGGILINTLLAPRPSASAAAQLEASPTYSTSFSGNQARLFQPIPVQYGRHILRPDYASDPYQEFDGNDQYLYLLFSRGMGRSDVEDVRIGETVVWRKDGGYTGAVDDLEITFYDPGEQIDAFPVQVETSAEVAGQLLANIQWIGPYTAVPAGEKAHELSVDIILPQGLYRINDDASQGSATVSFTFEYREIDDSGIPSGDWMVLAQDNVTLTTATPHRRTYRMEVSPGRYEVRARRDNAWSEDDRVQDRLEWGGLRAHLDGPQAFSDISTMAMRVRANEQLTSQSSRQVSLVQTRILPVWDGNAWVDQPTRSIAWAAVDIAMNPVYGAGLQSARVDLAEFLSYDQVWEARGDHFDGVFDTRGTRFDAINTVLAAGRASISFLGDKVSMVRDEQRQLASQVFSDRNIVRGSLEVEYILHREDSADDVIVEYMDETSWSLQEVRCSIAQSASQVPARVRAIGQTNRDHVWREGMHLAADNFFRRTTVRFRTELEGRLLKRGSTVLVQSEMPQTWGSAGFVEAVIGNDLTLSAAPETDPANTYIRIRLKHGGEWGPVKVNFVPGSRVVTMDAGDLALVTAQIGPIDDHLEDNGDEAPTYLLGEGIEFAFRGKVLKMEPERGQVSLEVVIDDPAVYSADQGISIPALPTPGLLPPSSGLPVITDLQAHREISVTESHLSVSARWPAGARSFVAEISYDGSVWTPVYEGSSPAFSVAVRTDALTVRMAGVGSGRGPWAYQAVAAVAPEIRVPPGTPIEATSVIEGSVGRAQMDAAARSLLAYLDDDETNPDSLAYVRRLSEQAAEGALAAMIAIQQRSDKLTAQAVRAGVHFQAEVSRLDVAIVTETAALASSILDLTATVEGKADASALSALDARVTTAEGTITSQALSITQLMSDLSGLTGTVDANATVLNGLTTTVMQQGNDISANAAAITQVSAMVDGATAGGFYRLSATAGTLPAGVAAEYVVQLNRGTPETPDFESAGEVLQLLTGGGSRKVFMVDQVFFSDGANMSRGIYFENGKATLDAASVGTVTAGKMQSEDGKFLIDLDNKRIRIIA